ncbi:hypothetical protein TNCV_518941 [Trichonephila clavipes]|nr:hypothetical protein TNCV_518941 [Trichonephila clavipes]
MKSLVFETPVNSAEELVARISAAAGEIRNTPEMLSNVRRSMKRRCEACITCGGRQTATAGSDVVQSGRPIFDNFFQHLWPYIGNNTANVVFQMVKRLWLIRTDR